jgi:hypothetical protein
VITTSLPEHLSKEMKRTILREAIERYRHELLPDEERMLLLDRIRRLKKSLGLWGPEYQPGRGYRSSGPMPRVKAFMPFVSITVY